MIFKRLLLSIWSVFDVLCFVAGIVVLNVTMWQLGVVWFGLTLAVSLFAVGWLSEVIAAKGGDN